MRVLKPDNVGLIYRGYIFEKKPMFSVAALGLFTLDESAGIRIGSEAELWPAITAALGQDAVLDDGLPKPRGEYLVYGAACSNQPVEMLEVFVKIGSMEKRLVVFGDHYWKHKDIGRPEIIPYTRIPITWERAFGGPEYKANPVGLGMVKDEKGWILAPNVQDINHLIESTDQRPEPFGMNALPPDWPPRSDHLGAFDKHWLIDHWPYYPADTNPEHFNTAPTDQRAHGFFQGDEAIEIHNMNPGKPVIRSQLPSVRARIFVIRSESSNDTFFEIESHLETIWLFPELNQGVLLFRGTILSADEDYDDLTFLSAHFEPMAEDPKPKDYYYQWLMNETAPEDEPEPEDAAEEPSSPPTDGPPGPPSEIPPSPGIEALMSEIEGLKSQIEIELGKIGVTTEDAMAQFSPPILDEPEAAVGQHEVETAIEELEQQTRQIVKDHNLDPAMVEQMANPPAAGEIPALDSLIAGWKATPGFDPELGAEIDQALAGILKVETEIASLAEAGVASSPTEEAMDEAPQAEAGEISAEEVLARGRAGESLAGLNLTGLDLSGADLAGVDLKGAVLELVLLDKANLSGADFSEAIMTGASLSNADLTGAILTGASANHACFARAELKGADLSEGDFTGSDFVEADLNGAKMDRAIFDLALMNRIDARKAQAQGAEFIRSILSRANFTGADLTGADLTGAEIVQTDFDAVQAPHLRLHGVSGKHASFLVADLKESRAGDGALLTGANLTGADLSDASWTGTDLSRANLSETILTRADFSKAGLHGADLRCASARGASFIKADLSQARMEGLDLLDGSLRKANLSQADLRRANLFAVDMYKVRLGGHDFEGANLGRTVLKMKVE